MIRRRYFIDLYACHGGCSVGYARALAALGIVVLGVDLWEDHKPRLYPFPGHKGDVLVFLRRLLAGEALRFYDRNGYPTTVTLDDVVGFGASPPCHVNSAGTRGVEDRDTKYPDLIAPTRDLLDATGLPYIIENVEGAGPKMIDPVLLCGSMFGLATEDEDGFPLRLERHRLFEANFPIVAPGPCDHDPEVWAAGVYSGARHRPRTMSAADHRHLCRHVRKGGYVPKSLEVRRRLLGIDWPAGEAALNQAIPPAYTTHLGNLLAAHLTRQEVPA